MYAMSTKLVFTHMQGYLMYLFYNFIVVGHDIVININTITDVTVSFRLLVTLIPRSVMQYKISYKNQYRQNGRFINTSFQQNNSETLFQNALLTNKSSAAIVRSASAFQLQSFGSVV